MIMMGIMAGLLAGSVAGCGIGGGEENEARQTVPDDNYRTFYEVFVYSFFDGNGDGIGDLKGLTEKLNYIGGDVNGTDAGLGCNGIWLMPVMPSGSYHKYDVTDYYSIDETYGTMEDFANFMEACKERDIHVIMDLVINHTSSAHPWFVQASSYLRELGEGEEPKAEECPYVDYYNFSEEKKTGYCELDGRWYYEAVFGGGMPDLNLGNEKVREEIEGIADFWLDQGADGFRLDAAKEYYSGRTSDNISFLAWFNTMVKAKKEDAYLVAEVWTDLNTYASYYKSGIDSVFDFAFADSSGIIANVVKGITPAGGYGKALEATEEKFSAYNPDYIGAPFYTNHDLGRSAGYYAGDNSERQTKIAGALNLMMSGSAYIYYGEELGMKGSGKDENKRAPMYWSKAPETAGMCLGPKAMDNVKMKFDSLEEQKSEEQSIYHYYRNVVRLRNTYPEIARGKSVNVEELSDEQICTVRKTYNGSELLLMMNLSPEEREVDVSGVTVNGKEAGEKTLAEELLTGEEPVSAKKQNIELPPYSILIFK